MFRLFLPIFLSLTASPAPAPALNPAVLLQFAFEFIDFFFKVGDASFHRLCTCNDNASRRAGDIAKHLGHIQPLCDFRAPIFVFTVRWHTTQFGISHPTFPPCSVGNNF